MLNYSGSGIETTFTQGEDACLASLVPIMPRRRGRPSRKSLLVVGAMAEVVEDQFSAAVRRRWGWGPTAFLPPRRSTWSCRRWGPIRGMLLAQPFLAETARALEARGAQCGCRRRSRWGRRGHDGVAARGGATLSGVERGRFDSGSDGAGTHAGEADARWKAVSRAAGGEGAMFFFPDSQLELPLARFLHASWGWGWSRRERRICTASTWPRSWRWLPAGTLLSEGQDVERQLDRCRAAKRRTSTVCGLGLANPLEAEGIATKWSIELLFTPIQGL